jgi:uncharacterized protein (DUF2147 family)
MKKLQLFSLFCALFILFSCSTKSAQNVAKDGIIGLWKSTDEHSDQPRALVAIYEYQGQYYGRMLGTYDDNGNFKDTILEKKERAPGVVGNPPYCGMDFVFNVTKDDDDEKYEGKIIDPEQGKVYDAELWRDGDDLIVRGKIWIFGKNITWFGATEKDLPKGFSMREIKSFVPVVPEAL